MASSSAMASRNRSRTPRRQSAAPAVSPYEAFRPFVERHRAAAAASGDGGGPIITHTTNRRTGQGRQGMTNILRIMGGRFGEEFTTLEGLADLEQADQVLRRVLVPGRTYTWQLFLTWNVPDDTTGKRAGLSFLGRCRWLPRSITR